MAVKKAPVKKSASKAVAKKAPARVARAKRGDGYECAVCGLAVTIDEACDCIDVCDIICCGKPMKAKAARK